MSRYTTGRWGTVEILTGCLNLHGHPIINIPTPENPDDVVTKKYVDECVASGGDGKTPSAIGAGEGLTLVDQTLNVNPIQTHFSEIASSTGSMGTLNVTQKLTVPIDPTTPAEAVSKQYVDNSMKDQASKEYVDSKITSAGQGLTIAEDTRTFSVNEKLPHVTSIGAVKGFRLAVQYVTPESGDTVVLGDYSHTIIDPTGTLTSLNLELPANPEDGQTLRVRTTQTIELINTGEFPTGVNQDLPPSLDVDEVLHYIYASGTGKWFRF